ncbi:MAG: methylenetetrahydrofolate reductase [NAD(P)H] [Alphaproteobacteria bacterium]|nr:methylenetetrahydrofolate reductase [NAD(P)H] [Alphaproteobacteria bacterium]
MKPTISFEFFPPKTEKSTEMLWKTVAELATLDPKFMTVTYGAGGSTRDGTVNTIEQIMEQTNIPTGSHLTFINTPKEELHSYIDELWNKNIHHIIALRGDMPDNLQWPLDSDGDYFQYTSDFVEGLKKWHAFEISVGCYPEKHPDAPSLEADIQALKLKCDAGADRALTQFFFENDKYYSFVDKCRVAGIDTPICPGLVPIHDFKSLVRFAKNCNANIPDWLHEKFDGLEDKPEEAMKIATDLLVEQTLDLAGNGVKHFHFYTLNKVNIIREACTALGYKIKSN